MSFIKGLFSLIGMTFVFITHPSMIVIVLWILVMQACSINSKLNDMANSLRYSADYSSDIHRTLKNIESNTDR
jgi:hypothetical protein